jgi:hypothetical protein
MFLYCVITMDVGIQGGIALSLFQKAQRFDPIFVEIQGMAIFNPHWRFVMFWLIHLTGVDARPSPRLALSAVAN